MITIHVLCKENLYNSQPVNAARHQTAAAIMCCAKTIAVRHQTAAAVLVLLFMFALYRRNTLSVCVILAPLIVHILTCSVQLVADVSLGIPTWAKWFIKDHCFV